MSIVWIIVLLTGGVLVWSVRRAKSSKARTTEKTARSVLLSCSQSEREAHYMRNFWNYDGSEQQDWDEEG